MARNEIVDKLHKFLYTHRNLTEECHVVYLLVEIRKIIDQDNLRNSYRLLKFYADWAVHSCKDTITDEIKTIAKQMYDEAESVINSSHGLLPQNSVINDFTYMGELRNEFESFLKAHDLDNDLVKAEDKWIDFISLLIKVLENQPIKSDNRIKSKNRIPNIKEIRFIPSNHKCAILRITFEQPINGYDYYEFLNAF